MFLGTRSTGHNFVVQVLGLAFGCYTQPRPWPLPCLLELQHPADREGVLRRLAELEKPLSNASCGVAGCGLYRFSRRWGVNYFAVFCAHGAWCVLCNCVCSFRWVGGWVGGETEWHAHLCCMPVNIKLATVSVLVHMCVV